MPSYEVTADRTPLFEQPSEDAGKSAILHKGDILILPRGRPGDTFIGVMFAPEGFTPRSGFVLRSACTEIPDGPPSAIDKEAFIRECLIAERSMNALEGIAPFVVVADGLIARALIETDLSNPPPPGSVVDGQDGVGPLQVTSAEWEDFLRNGGDLKAGLTQDDRIFPTLQVYGAAFRMHKDGKAISDANTQPDADPNSEGPFLPSYLDLLHAYLANSPEAAVALLGAQNNNLGAKTLGAPDNVLKPEAIAAIAAHPKFQGQVDGSTTVDDLVKQTEGLLASSLKSAFDLIKQFAPEQVPQPAASGAGPAPWFNVALQDKDKVADNEPVATIKAYFAATDFQESLDPLPAWCGAFAAHCVKDSHSGAPVPRSSAVAASWNTFGDPLPAPSPDTPIGAIVVMSKAPGAKTISHVAFFSGFDSATGIVKLLGGNQHKGVNETGFPQSEVVAVRWFDVSGGAGTGTGPAHRFNFAAVRPSVDQRFWQFGDMIASMFGAAGYTPVQQAAAIANAIGESGLDPTTVNQMGESSVGLFQCNQLGGGLGSGRSVSQLQDPKTNIQIVLTALTGVQKFKQATSVEDVEAAVDAFVRFVEQPKHPEDDIAKRIVFAKQLLQPLPGSPAPPAQTDALRGRPPAPSSPVGKATRSPQRRPRRRGGKA
jgi:uncharacterized protein (TIGR02594 family)